MVTVMPGDVVLGKMGVVIFIPPHLAEKVVKTSEIVRLRDMFGHQRLRDGVYTAGQMMRVGLQRSRRIFQNGLTITSANCPWAKSRYRSS